MSGAKDGTDGKAGAVAGKGTYRCTCIVLDKTKLGEKDLILTLLAESGRQVRAVAKGARRPGSRLAARCELFCTVDLLLARGKNLDVVSQAELVEAPLGSQPAYELVGAASAVAEVASLCSYEGTDDPFVYAITAAALRTMPGLDGARLDLVVAAYVFKLLSHMGYRPELDGCVLCGDPDPLFFSAAAGGLVCASCATTEPGSQAIEPGQAAWLRALIGLTFKELAGADIDLFTAEALLSLAHTWAATHLDARLRAMEFMLGV